ncbi:MAG: glutaredoxin family protein [Burkholderiaceae bacterium]
MSREITVYSTPLCAPCVRLKHYLDEQGIAYIAKDLLMDEDAAEKIEDLGIRSTPVLEVDGNFYSGTQLTPENLKAILGTT